MKITAQELYDLRELTGELSGTELHKLFVELTGEPSPSGYTEIEVDPQRCHPFIAMLWQPLSAHADGIQRYAGIRLMSIPASTLMIDAVKHFCRKV